MKFITKCSLTLALCSHLYANCVTKIGIISDSKYCGEREVGWRIKIAAESLGWEAILDESRGNLLKTKQLDFAICLLPFCETFLANANTYQTIFHPFNFLKKDGSIIASYRKYPGFLMTIEPKEKMISSYKTKTKEFRYVPFYPTIQKIEYKPLDIKTLVTMVPVWSNRLNDEKFQRLYRMLSETGYARFYGIHRNEQIVPYGFMGSIPFDGSSVINVLQRHGITLILHSDIHNNEGIPTSRIFEAAAASTVIISDENSFVRKHFGDCAFFIDTSLSSNEIFKQIDEHVSYIFSHPEEAKEMARKAHEIFEEKFLMTDQLLNIKKMHDEIQATRR